MDVNDVNDLLKSKVFYMDVLGSDRLWYIIVGIVLLSCGYIGYRYFSAYLDRKQWFKIFTAEMWDEIVTRYRDCYVRQGVNPTPYFNTYYWDATFAIVWHRFSDKYPDDKHIHEVPHEYQFFSIWMRDRFKLLLYRKLQSQLCSPVFFDDKTK